MDGRGPVYPGNYPRALCYKLVGGIADDKLWVAWIDNAAALWNAAKTGWTFKKCETEEENKHPNIIFKFNPTNTKIPGGAKGYGRGGGENAGNWEIQVEPDVTNMSINGTTVGTGGNKGWALEDKNGTKTLDPQLVVEHELGHALGLDHNPGACFAPKTGNVEDPICAGAHKGPNGRNPSASDIAEVKRGIEAAHKAAEDAKKTAGGAGGSNGKDNQATPPVGANTDQQGQIFYYCDNPAGYYPQVPNCSTPWRTIATGGNGPPPSDDAPPDSGPGPTMTPSFGFGGFGFGLGGGRGSDDGMGGRDATTRQQRRP